MLKRLLSGAFRRTRRADPGALEPRLAEAARLAEAGSRARADALYRSIIEAYPDSAAAFAGYGWFACAEESWERAGVLFGRAAALAPDAVAGYIGLGYATLRRGNPHSAIEHYETALRIEPGNATALQHLASIHYRLGDGERVRALFAALEALSPASGRSIAAALMLPSMLESNEEIERVRARLSDDIERLGRDTPVVRDPAAEVDVTAFYLAYHGRDDRALQERIAALHLKACPGLAYVAPHCAGPAKRLGGRIRVGVVSRFLYRHSIGRVMQGLIAKLDPARFEIYACTFDAPVDSVSRAIEDDAQAWVILPRQLEAARETLAQHAFDVLLYPDIGMDPFTYFLSFARLAPVQCTTWGHPVTTGVPNVDYFLSTDYFEPEEAQAHYSERLVMLTDVAFPGYHYRREVPAQASAADVGFDRGRHVYFCPQALFKLHPDFDAILTAILRRDPAGEIVITHDVELDAYRLPRLQARLRRIAGDLYERIVFMPRADRFETYLQRLQACEVVLDPVHYCGGNTSLDALSAGALLVTLPSGYNRGRHTYGFFRKMRFMETVADTPGQYVDIAVRIATDGAHRARLKSLQSAAAEALYEDPGAVEQLARFFEDALTPQR